MLKFAASVQCHWDEDDTDFCNISFLCAIIFVAVK